MTQHARLLAPTVALAVIAATAGCADDHDHDHASHVDPDHRPADFPDAVDRLIAGHVETREALSAGRIDEAHDVLLPVQRDLARWLPEVAADSDMPESPWDRVDALSARLLASYEAAIADLDADQNVGGDRIASAEPELDDLRRLRDEANPAWFARPRAKAERVDDETDSAAIVEGSVDDAGGAAD